MKVLGRLLFIIAVVIGARGTSVAQGGSASSSGKAIVTIQAFDRATLKPLPARFLIREKKTGRQATYQSSRENPELKLSYSIADSLLIVATASGFQTQRESHWVDTLTAVNNQYNFWIFLRPAAQAGAPPPKKPVTEEVPDTRFENLRPGETIQLDRVYFDQSSYVLRAESYPQLDQLAASLRKYPALKIEIAGHTDNVGDDRLNQYLSENRARVIASYLRNKGISSARLVARGYGSSRPLADNDTEANRARNRRVEFTVVNE
ncbi:OmpA family protein [Telluribacter sp. SYSU D00476]|uniref:OmpA family protein n=1 Tax=Telluribacter sp. SYSU D00476 TaxID=2811430 RepID=UPI001FF5589F|nr:OmpA family protein [Telluribacter sp. SYSU D00476]